MGVFRLGQVMFLLALAGVGVLSLIFNDFALVWQPYPAWLPWRPVFAQLSGTLLLVACVGVLIPRTAAVSAMVLAIYESLWVLMRGAPVLSAPLNVGAWLGLGEALAACLGGWLLWRTLRQRSIIAAPPLRILFGLCCVSFGLSHFAYADFTASMIPTWLPAHTALAYLSGAGHLAAGLALISGVLPRAAATLEALMLTSIVLLVHVPSIGAHPPPEWAPTARFQWTALCMALVLAASAWLLASALQRRPWIELRLPR
jgi:uncharacterized membrane protein YphA (DoxX/SURF4 family)